MEGGYGSLKPSQPTASITSTATATTAARGQGGAGLSAKAIAAAGAEAPGAGVDLSGQYERYNLQVCECGAQSL